MTYGHAPVNFQGKSWVTLDSGAYNRPELGAILRDGDEEYVFVHNAGASTLSVSYGCVLSAVTGHSVTVSSTTSVDLLYGVCKHADIPAYGYGWVLRRGFAAVEMEADNSAAAGQLLTLAAAGEFALKSNSTGYPAPAIGKTMEAIASGASGQAYIRCF